MNISSVPYQRSANHGLIQPPVFVNKVSLKCSQLFVSGCFPTGHPRWLTTCRCRRHERHQFDPWVAGSLEKGRQPTPVLSPGESHGQRSLVGYIQFMGSQGVGHHWATEHTALLSHCHRAGRRDRDQQSAASPAPHEEVCQSPAWRPHVLPSKPQGLPDSGVSRMGGSPG